jgi:NADH:ubiquinone oxidoreductase subunit H
VEVILGLLVLFYSPFFFEWVERKTRARFQNRYGPRYNTAFGFFQPVFDFLKLMGKRKNTPSSVERYFEILPFIRLCVLVPAFMIWYIPFGYSVFVVVAVLMIDSMVVWMMGYGQRNRYALVGSARNLLQKISFEVPLFILLITPGILNGNFNIAHTFNPLLVFGFFIMLFVALAELEMLPFDAPHAAEEVVAGWKTEYSGPLLAITNYTSNLKFVFVSLAIATLYFGPQLFWLSAIVIGFLISLISAAFARYRITDVVSVCWRIFVPLSVLQMVVIWMS